MAKPKLNPMERALAQADKIIAANNELMSQSALYHDRRGEDRSAQVQQTNPKTQ